MPSSYSEKLRDPRWQKKRLEVMQRDNFRCVKCGNDKETLNVHHCFYARGNDPWEYPETSLVTLCETCHQEEGAYGDGAKELLVMSLLRRGVLTEEIVCIARALAFTPDLSPTFTNVLEWSLRNKDICKLLVNLYEKALAKPCEKHGVK